MPNQFAAARRASGLTCEAAARAAGVSRPTLSAREARPGEYRLDELRGLLSAMDGTGRRLLMEAVEQYLR